MIQIQAMIAALTIGMDAPVDTQEVECLTEAIYFEARGESLEGYQAVAETLLNRMEDKRYPKTACGVAREGVQFSYYSDGLLETYAENDREVIEDIILIASHVLLGYTVDNTLGATHFYAHNKVTPFWVKDDQGPLPYMVIGNHTFVIGVK
jgi:spore germination cell wall hydrolase CwlJ-like protein